MEFRTQKNMNRRLFIIDLYNLYYFIILLFSRQNWRTGVMMTADLRSRQTDKLLHVIYIVLYNIM